MTRAIVALLALCLTLTVAAQDERRAALSGEPPLTREIRASLYGNGRQPLCRTAVYGVGGLPLRMRTRSNQESRPA